MKALTLKEFNTIEHLEWQELPTPKPKAHEVQIQIAYTAVNPVDWKICEGWLKKLLPHSFPLIPGWDAAGVITALGDEVKDLSVGNEVYAYCRKPIVQWGTYAEYVCFDAEHVALKPASLTFAQAAAIPLVGLTAWQALFDAADLKSGQSILIHAGAGGVGSLAIEFARVANAKIFTTASEAKHAYVKELGADIAIDYTKEDFVKKVKELEPEGVDVILDCVGYDTLEKCYDLVKPGGHLVSIVNHVDEPLCKQKGIHGHFVFVRPDGMQLKRIADLIDSGEVKAPNIVEMNLNDYEKALKENKEGHTKGKIVLKVAEINRKQETS